MKLQTIEEIYNNIIHKKIIDMAIEGTLPMDLTELNFGYFEDEVKKHLNEGKLDKIYEKAGEFLSIDEDMTIEKAVELVANSEKDTNTMLDYAHMDVFVVQHYEYRITIAEFLEQIGYYELNK